MENWSRLPDSGWLMETDHAVMAAERCPPGDGEGWLATVAVRGRLVFSAGPFLSAEHAAGVARGWSMKALEGRTG